MLKTILDRHKDVSVVPSAWDDLVRNYFLEDMEIIHRLFPQDNWLSTIPYPSQVALVRHIEMLSAR
jgi:hypothetical protein